MSTGKYELLIKWPSGQSTLAGEITDGQYGEMCRVLSPDYSAQAQAAPEAEPYGYLREVDGNVQLSIGHLRPANRSGGFATPWAAIFAAPQHDAELVVLLREAKTWIDNNSCHGTDAIDLMSRIDAQLANLSTKNEGGKV